MGDDKITDTSKLAREQPAMLLLDAMTQGTEESINAMERAGQAEVIAAAESEEARLPIDLGGYPRTDEERAAREAPYLELGFVFGEPVDELFRKATLPAGWKPEPGDNPYGYWTYLVDEKGFKRASIFYKAAFYDRSATMHLISAPTTAAQDETVAKIMDWDNQDRFGWRRKTDSTVDGVYMLALEGPQLERRFLAVAPDGTIVTDTQEEPPQ